MSAPVGRVGRATETSIADSSPDRARKLRKAAGDFESVLVKQLLKDAKMCGSEKEGGYGDMAVDALASAIEKGGGLGLATSIEHAVARQGAAPQPAASGTQPVEHALSGGVAAPLRAFRPSAQKR